MIAAISGQMVISALTGSFIGEIFVKSGAMAPRIQNGTDSKKTNPKNGKMARTFGWLFSMTVVRCGY